LRPDFRGSLSSTNRSRSLTSSLVSAIPGATSGADRLTMVIQKILQPIIQKVAIKFTKRSAVRSFDSSALQPDFIILWNVSIFQRSAYQFSFSIASTRVRTGKSVISHSLDLSSAAPQRAHNGLEIVAQTLRIQSSVFRVDHDDKAVIGM
jgi:hypothetical protein